MNTYIGARYVPIFGRRGESSAEWDNSAPYEPLTVVLYQGASYTSRQTVPTGIDIHDTEYWVLSGNYNAQVEAYRQEVFHFDDRITANEEGVEENADAIAAERTARQNADQTLTEGLSAEVTARQNADTAINDKIGAGFSSSSTVREQLDAKAATSALTAETTARQNADTAINDKIGTGFSSSSTVRMQLDAKAASSALSSETTARQNADTAINDKIGTGFSSSSTVRSQLDAKAAQTALDALAAKLPTGSFSSTNTVKKYIDDALENVSPLHYFGVIGDSFSDGSSEWPSIVRNRSNWVPVVVARSGSGFAPTSGSVQVPFIQQLRNLANNALWPKVEKIIVYGAHNDWADVNATAAQTSNLVSEFVSEWYSLTTAEHRPQLIFVIGNCGKPDRSFSRTYGGYPEYVNTIITNLKSWGYMCVSAYAWLLGLSDAYFQEDNLHPSEYGHRIIATNMLSLLTGTYTSYRRRRSFTTNETGWKDTKVEVDIYDTSISIVCSAKKDGAETLSSGNIRLSTIPHLWFGTASTVYDTVQLMYNVIFARYYGGNFEVIRSLYNPLVGYVGINLQTEMNFSDNYNILFSATTPIV